MQLLLLVAMLLAGGEPNHAAAAAAPLPGVHSQSEQASLTSNANITPFITEGDSMNPTIVSGDTLDVDSGYYRSHKLARGDIIVFRAPDERIFVKRVVGLPGETIRFEQSELYVDGKLEEEWPLKGNTSSNEEVKLSGKQLYVLGDNYAHSYDSRYIGPIETDSVTGKVIGIKHKQSTQAAVKRPAVKPPQPSARQAQPAAKSSRSAVKTAPAFIQPPQPKLKASARSSVSQITGR